MANTMREISNICRFCLGHTSLNPLSEVTSALLGVQDIELFTGITITDEERLAYAICDECCNSLQNSAAFRGAAMNNDIIFKQVFSMLIESAKAESKSFENTLQIEIIDNPLDNVTEYQTVTEETQFDETSSIESENYDIAVVSLDSRNATEYSDGKKRRKTINSVAKRRSKRKSGVDSKQADDAMKEKKSRKKELCVICGKLVLNLYLHNVQHTGEKNYTCPHCQVKLRNQTNMRRHIEAVHMKKIIKTCEVCGKGFTHRNIYLYHMVKQHAMGKTYECKMCSRSFNRFSYRAHMNKWHKIQKEFSCEICSKTFNENKKLTIHQRVHSTDQPYACSLCPKRFKSHFARKTHELVHTGVRFSCTLCVKSYRYKSLLAMHYRKDHAGATPGESRIECENT